LTKVKNEEQQPILFTRRALATLVKAIVEGRHRWQMVGVEECMGMN
jgi:hypothetical protein